MNHNYLDIKFLHVSMSLKLENSIQRSCVFRIFPGGGGKDIRWETQFP